MFAVSKAADLNFLAQEGQLYWTFPFRKGYLVMGDGWLRDSNILPPYLGAGVYAVPLVG
jgi:hypothetical protein